MRAGKRLDRGCTAMRTDSAMLYLRADSSSSGSPLASAMTGETGSYTYMAPEVSTCAAWGLPSPCFNSDMTCCWMLPCDMCAPVMS